MNDVLDLASRSGIDLSSSLFIYIGKLCIYLSIGIVCILFKNAIIKYYNTTLKLSTEGDFQSLSGQKAHTTLAIYISAAVSLLFGLMGVLPNFLFKRAEKNMLKAFDDCLADSLSSLASSIEAGLTLQKAFEVAIESTALPFSRQAEKLIMEYKLGVDIDTALKNVMKRVPTTSSKTAFGALLIGRKLGGPLPQILRRISASIREITRVEGRLSALTAQGKGQGVLVCSMPILVVVGMAIFSRGKMEMLTTELSGQLLLFTVFFLEALGIFFTKKTLHLEI